MLAKGVAIFAVSLFLTVFLANSFTPTGESSAADQSVDINLNIEPVLSLGVVDNSGDDVIELAMEVTPTVNGTFVSAGAYIKVSTNNQTGYLLALDHIDEDDASLVSPTTNTPIATLSADTTISAFPKDTWGYNFNQTQDASNNLLFSPVPTFYNPDVLHQTTAPSNDTFPLTVGANISTNTKSGVYTGTIEIIAVTNYVPEVITYFPSNLVNLQQMTASICRKVSTPSKDATTVVTSATDYTDTATQIPQITLTDTRDNNTYTVRKLADGNCWMTQNLRLGSTGAITLTPADSNVSSNFDLPAASTTTSSWAPSGEDQAAISNIKLFDSQNTSYGVYYNWHTATANTGAYDTAEAPSSLCAKGWALPSGEDLNNLFRTYSYSYNLLSISTSSVLSGLYLYSGSIGYQNQYGYQWASDSYSTDTLSANGAMITESAIGPGHFRKVNGLPIRCIVK